MYAEGLQKKKDLLNIKLEFRHTLIILSCFNF